MTLLLRTVGGYLVDTALWLVVVVAVSAAAALVVSLVVDRASPSRRSIMWSAIGAVFAASTAHRFDVTPWLVEIGRRDLPLLWASAGAVATAIVTVVMARRHAT